MKPGKLYVIGVGPGDPELLTVKAMKALNGVPCVFVPKGREEGSSLALSIVAKLVNLDGKEIVEAHFPMMKTRRRTTGDMEGEPEDQGLDAKWDNIVEGISGRLGSGSDVAFITLGDPSIYSTFFYLYDKLRERNPDQDIDIIPGVSSINAAAARAEISLALADEKIAVVPATYVEDLRGILKEFDTVVIMKVNKVFDKIMEILEEVDLAKQSIYVSRAGMEDEIVLRDMKAVKEKELNYFSVLIVKK